MRKEGWAHNLAKSVVTLEPGRHVRFGTSPDLLLVPLNFVD
jgi:hypothetical protein